MLKSLLKKDNVVKTDGARIKPFIRLYIIRQGVVYERWGIMTERGKVVEVRKTWRGWEKTGNEFIVKDEHFYLEEERKSRKPYMILSVFVDANTMMSIPPPHTNSKPWNRDEVELATKVVSNLWIMKMFEEERKKLMNLMARFQIIMLLMFIAVLVFLGIMYYNVNASMAEQIRELINRLYPTPVGG